MDAIATLVDGALAEGLGSAVAVSVGDAGREVFRLIRGTTRRVPDRGQPVTERTMWDLASLTKPMSTVAIAMQLVAAGQLDLTTPIRRWLPASASPHSVRHLLGHAAGCIAHVEFFRWLRGSRPTDPRSALVERAQQVPISDQAPVYSDLGFIQLGRIVELAAERPLEQAFADFVGGPLGLTARFAPEPIHDAVATEIDERGVVTGLVHDENCYYGGRVCGHAGLFGSIDDVAKFAAAMVGDRFPARDRFFTDAPTDSTWRLGWDTPSHTPGISQAGDLWPRVGAVGHTGFTGTSFWLDGPNRRWCIVLANRVHPTRFGTTADRIKALRRAIGDAAVNAFRSSSS
ncbi:MAG: serine hydrolase domain-containing protein [Kofleriaceae bacterium]